MLKASGVLISSYEQFQPELSTLAQQAGASIWLDPASASLALWQWAKPAAIVSTKFPIALWKAVKNEAEQNGMRSCHVQDAVALTRFLSWLETDGVGVSETRAAAKLLEFRKEESGFVCVSFDTILGAGANGAIIHYHPTDKRPAVIGSQDVVLIDSGGHYRNGTTDVTRTVHMGTPTEHQKRCYTRVLQGHVDMARAVVANNIRPGDLDILARLPLFSDGLDYRHGTGHGVGAYLNVHEYPPGVFGRSTDSLTLQPGFIFSNEPGYYESGAFGIRIESLLLCKKAQTRHSFHHASYLDFENLTVVPFSRKLIEVDLLSQDQVRRVFFCQVCFLMLHLD